MKKYWNPKTQNLNWEFINQQNWAIDMQACPQDPLWHAEGDVWTHTRMVIDALHSLPEYTEVNENQQIILTFAALWHDIAKPECTTIEDGRITSPRHAKIGELMLRRLIWEADFEARELICALVRLHGLPLWALQKERPNAAVIAASLRLDTNLLYTLAKADVLGRICTDQNQLLERAEFFAELCKENECWQQPKQFYNSHSQFKFFQKSEDYPSEIFDDTDFEVTLLCGLPGSGKDTYAAQLNLPIVSMDDIRKELKISPLDKAAQGQVQQLAYERAKEHCRRHRSFVWNSTNLTKELRSKLISTLSVYNPKFKIVYLEAPWRETLAVRSDYIPESALEKMQRLLEMPTLEEAHEVLYLRR